jgi:hypothetical protein
MEQWQFTIHIWRYVILKMSDIKDDMDPIRAMHRHGSMPDAQCIVEVWAKFVAWCENVVLVDKIGCIVA